jgi:NADH dehydrogenase
MVNGSFAVINCVGILYESRKSKFYAAHTELPRQLATACKRYGVERFVHLSALGVDQAKSDYAKTKRMGEEHIREILPSATILRPSVIFGPEDNFFNMFAKLAQVLPALPLIGGGQTKFQPVFVGDVADAVLRAVMGSAEIRGKVYELGGPEILTLRQIYQRIFDETGMRCMLLPLPFFIARLQAWFLQKLPTPLLTIDQVRSLETDSIVAPQAKILIDLGVTPTTLEVVLPTYLSRFRAGGKFAELKHG